MRSLTTSIIAVLLVAAGVSATTNSLNPSANAQARPAGMRPAPPTKRGHEATGDMPGGMPPSFSPRIARPDRRSRASPCPSITKTGYIEVKDATQSLVGYVDKSPNELGLYGLTHNVADVLTLSVVYPACSSFSEAIDLQVTNGPFASSYPFLGGVVGAINGFDNLGLGSDSYIFLGGTGQNIPNSPPYQAGNSHTAGATDPSGSESAIWTYQATSGLLSPQWVNTDGSKPDTSIVYQSSTDTLLLSGDPTAFSTTWGASPAVTFTFVPTN